MTDDSKNAGNPAPVFEEIGNSFSVTLPFRERISKAAESLEKSVELHKLSERQRKIVDILEKGPMARQQIRNRLGLKITDRALQRELAVLKSLGVVKSTGNARRITWSLTNF